MGFGGGEEIEKERFSKRNIFFNTHWKERESSFGSSSLVKEKRSSLVSGETEKDFQVWSSWLPVHFFSTYQICVLMLKIIFFLLFLLWFGYGLLMAWSSNSLPSHHSLSLFTVFRCRLLGYWWVWRLIIHLLLVWFKMRMIWFHFNCTTPWKSYFVILFRFFFPLPPL